MLDSTAEWTNKVELADLNGDGRVDLLFANGGNYSTPGDPEMNRAFFNQGAGERFVERTSSVFGASPDLTRVIMARDLDGDGIIDVFVGNTYQTTSRIFLGTGGGEFVERTSTHLPGIALSVGDAEFGDIDGDGDLDLVTINDGEMKSVLGIAEGGITPYGEVNAAAGRVVFDTSMLRGDRSIAVEAFDLNSVIVIQAEDARRAFHAFYEAVGVPTRHP